MRSPTRAGTSPARAVLAVIVTVIAPQPGFAGGNASMTPGRVRLAAWPEAVVAAAGAGEENQAVQVLASGVQAGWPAWSTMSCARQACG